MKGIAQTWGGENTQKHALSGLSRAPTLKRHQLLLYDFEYIILVTIPCDNNLLKTVHVFSGVK